MWKFVTRSIRETFERRTCRTNVYSQTSQDNHNCEENESVTPNFFSTCDDYFRNTRTGANDKNDQSHYNAKYTWFDAVSWSSFLAIGYVVCQSLHLNRKLFEIDNKNYKKWNDKFLIYPQLKTSHLLSQTELFRPNQRTSILIDYPNEYKNSINTFDIQTLNFQRFYEPVNAHILPVNNELSESEDRYEISHSTSDFQKIFGPITAQEAFEEAVNEFSYTHQKIMGELELDCGSKALEEKRYEDALEHFITGTKLSSSGSMFNLALCYELGLGTSVDFVKAAKYYKKAANKGHIDAIYNLGVFYAQGKGGLKRNKDTARNLFIKAAKKGQTQALKALQLEESLKKHLNKAENTKYNLKIMPLSSNIKNNVLTKLKNYGNILQTNFNSQKIKANSDKFIDSIDGSVNSQDSTNTFLEMICLNGQSILKKEN